MHREPPRLSVVGGLVADVRHALRALIAHGSYTATATLTLALGIGANAAVFNLANWLLLRPLPGVVRESELVTLNFGSNDGGTGPVSVPTVDRLAANVPALREIAGYQDVAVHAAAATGAAPRRLDSEIVSGNYFDVLGGPLEMGRGFTFEEGRDPGRPPVVVVSDRFWRHDLGSGPDVLSRSLTINGTAWTIVGVAVPAFHGPTRTGDTDIWVPIAQHVHILPVYGADLITSPKARVFYGMVGRLAPGASLESGDRADRGRPTTTFGRRAQGLPAFSLAFHRSARSRSAPVGRRAADAIDDGADGGGWPAADPHGGQRRQSHARACDCAAR